VKDLQKRFEKHDLNERSDLIKECQQIGIVTSQLLLNAGRSTGKKKYTHGRPFSGELDNIAQKFRREKNKLRLMKQQRHLLTNRSDEADMITTVQMTYKELRKIQKQAKKLRQEFLMQIAEKRSYEWHLSKAAAMNIIIQAEDIWLSYWRQLLQKSNAMRTQQQGG
jgi:hypothetical protein